MATRFYLPSTGAATISPAFSTWTSTTGADILTCVTTRISSAFTDKSTGNLGNLGANTTILSRAYVSAPLAAQTISASTIKGTIRALESAANDNLDAMRLAVRIVSADGTTFRSPVIYGPANSTVAEFDAALRAKRLATGGATGSVVVTAGDRVFIEIGITTTAGGTSVAGSVNYGDNSATDLGDNETDTAANNPFVEIAANLTFLYTADASITEAGDTVSTAGTLPIVGVSTPTEAGDTLSAAGALPIVGVATPTEDGDTLSSDSSLSGGTTYNASPLTFGGAPFGGLMFIEVSDEGITADASITEAGDTVSAAGTLPIVGTLTATEEGDTVSAAGTLPIVGAASITEAGDTLSSAGTLPIVGAASITEAGDTLSSAGALPIVATAEITEAGDTLSSEGGAPVVIGDADITEAGDTLSSAGTLPIVAALSVTGEGDSLSSAGTLPGNGALAVTEDSDTLSAAGTLPIVAAASITEEGDSIVSASTLALVGILSVTLEDDTLLATGIETAERSATLTVTEASDTLSATASKRTITIEAGEIASISDAGFSLTASTSDPFSLSVTSTGEGGPFSLS